LCIDQPRQTMDHRELESRVKALSKTVSANEPPETAIKLLESLKKDAAPTEEMLRVGDH
jgi:transcription elongation factor S-II